MLNPDRYFDPDPATRAVARALYDRAASLSLICPHGHVDPRLLADDRAFSDPATLLVVPDHYVTRMLYSQGISLERLGIPTLDGTPVEGDPHEIWRRFAEHFHLFRATPTGCWLKEELEGVFGISTPLGGDTADAIYDELQDKLARPEFRPRALFEQFNIEVLCTTDAATDTLELHQRLRASGWKGNIRPTFRPDLAVDILHPKWRAEITRLGEQTGQEIAELRRFITALEARRAFFKAQGATATDHAVVAPYTHELSEAEAAAIFARALAGQASADDARAFTAHMLMEFARMSVEDGLVMQIHPGSLRNHNQRIYQRFGPDRGCDIPVATEYTRNLQELLNKYGNEPTFTLVLFTLDETTYTRELAPLAGHYPAVRLGPPWWFHDSIEGMLRFRHAATETAGFYNTAGFNDDTRAFPSIPARHDLCRRVDANFLGRLVTRHILEEEEAHELIVDLSYTLAKRTYRLG
ncbi:MAG: glucuronate isomerase [Luteitalea sp.]|nr:glucuronate isomerase [Luteitalea sp.]